MELITLFKCPICSTIHHNEADGLKCMNRPKDEQLAKVGDIVEVKYGFGWFNGDKRWVINPDVDTRPHGFSKNESYGFYYVVTHIDNDGHRLRYHLATKAMTSETGYHSGFTYNIHHYTPKPINAPEEVILDAIELIGQISKNLVG